MVVDLFRSRAALEVEIWTLRQQINVLRRTAPKKQTFSSIDRLIFVCLYRLRPGVREALASIANPLWGAPRIHGELLKLGVDIGQTSVAKYMVRRRDPPSQGWRTFLRNHADGIAAMDMFVVPTISFRLLYGLLIMGHGRRHILWFGVTAHPAVMAAFNTVYLEAAHMSGANRWRAFRDVELPFVWPGLSGAALF